MASIHSVSLPNEESGIAPSITSILTFMATTVVRVESDELYYSRISAQKDSLPDPLEIEMEHEGVFIPLNSNSKVLIVEVERRRRSGRAVKAKCIFECGKGARDIENEKSSHNQIELEMPTTFSVGLTERQKNERGKVELPHYDAQVLGLEQRIKEMGSIEYSVEKVDDFDEDEDADEDLYI